MKQLVRIIEGFCWCFLLAITGFAAQNRVTVADHFSWEGKQGFFIRFENSAEKAPCPLSSLGLVLGVADGNGWRFAAAKAPWQFNRDYALKVVIAADHAEIFVDGVSYGVSAGKFAPVRSKGFTAWDQLDWAADPTDYYLYISAVTIRGSSGKVVSYTYPPYKSRSIQSILMNRLVPTLQGEPWEAVAGETYTIEASCCFLPYPKIQDMGPIIDRYGQFMHADWPGKVKTDADLQATCTAERRQLKAWGAAKGYDAFGGNMQLGWREPATGFYAVKKRNGRWWLITPKGYPCFYRGIDATPGLALHTSPATPVTGREFLFQWLPAKKGDYQKAWSHDAWDCNENVDYIDFNIVNMRRKYGKNWEKMAFQLMQDRVKAWGFSGLGKWCWSTPQHLPYFPVLGLPDVPLLVNHPDVFNPTIPAKVRTALEKQILPQKNDPAVVGWSIGNETGELIMPDEITAIMKMSGAVAAKQALIDELLRATYQNDVAKMAAAWGIQANSIQQLYATTTANIPMADIMTMRRHYEERYYHLLYTTVKSIDANHLYFGNWIIPGWTGVYDVQECEKDWFINARYCDVIGYDFYRRVVWDPGLLHLLSVDKPILCGENSYPQYNGESGFGYWFQSCTANGKESGIAYQQWMQEAATSPYCVGMLYFLYRDQPVTGRGPGSHVALRIGESYAFGLVDITDTPKWDMITRVRDANFAVDRWRMEK